MNERDERWQLLLAEFSGELEDHVRNLNQLLLKLEKGGDDSARATTFAALFREAHSLKGAARAVELGRVEELAHAIEAALDFARQQPSTPSDAWFDALYQGLDVLIPLQRAAIEEEEPPAELEEVLERLRNQGAALADPVQTAASPPAPEAPAPLASVPSAGTEPPRAGAATDAPPGGGPTTAAEEPLREGAATGASARQEGVRVSVSKLDALLSDAGELAVTRIRIEERLRELASLQKYLYDLKREARTGAQIRNGLWRARPDYIEEQRRHQGVGALLRFSESFESRAVEAFERLDEVLTRFRQDAAQLRLVTSGIEDEVMGVRLLPAATIFQPFERVVRDLTRAAGKEAELVISGEDTEIDRNILEQIRYPLLHMLRNAVDHGLETPDDRTARGKPVRGTITLSASQNGATIEIGLADDGVGLDPARLRSVAVAKGLVSPEQAASYDDAAALRLVFLPGFSTSEAVTETSGRGVGMDVVREEVERLNGAIEVSTVAGRGTRFTITLPLTLATTRAVLALDAGQVFAIPSTAIQRNLRVRRTQVVHLEGRRTIEIDGRAVPIIALSALLGRPTPPSDGEVDWQPLIVLHTPHRPLAVAVDDLVGEQELVVKTLKWPLKRVRNVAGATVLGSGEIVIILNPSDLARTGARLLETTVRADLLPELSTPAEERRMHVLVVEDSVTTRAVERSILEAGGYQVAVAGDGLEALGVLRRQTIDLVVADVDMPTMDGFTLTSEIRRDEHLRRIPVVLVTSLDSAEHKERGVSVGADAYIVKGNFDQAQLLETVGRLI